jgi:hypothetical protein
MKQKGLSLFVEKPKVIKSVQYNDESILMDIRNMFLDSNNYDLDPCYSSGKFYGSLEKPKIKMDKTPQSTDVIQNDILDGIPLANSSIRGIVFDPPFMFGTHGQTKNNIMTKRFTMFDTFNELEQMYKTAMKEFYRVLISGGIVAFKCQDYTDSKTTLTHCLIHNWAIEIGFKVEDIFVMVFSGGRVWNSNLKQKHARKYHSYWLVLKKTTNRTKGGKVR